MKLADKRSDVIKDLESVKYMSTLDFPLNEEYVKRVVRDAIGFIKMQDDHIRTIRGQRDKARRELRLKEGEGCRGITYSTRTRNSGGALAPSSMIM